MLKIKKSLFCMLMIVGFSIMMMLVNEIWLKWLIVEVSTILFIVIINMSTQNKIVSIYYYMISMICSLIMVFLIVMNYSFNLYDSMMSHLIELSMFMKLGIFPFSFWMISCYDKLGWFEIFFMSTFMKFLPMMFFMELLKLDILFMDLILLNMLAISCVSLSFSSMKKIIACSSINQTTMLILLFYISKLMFIVYFLLYMCILFLLIYMLNYMNINDKKDLKLIYNNKYMNFMYLVIIFIYSSLPPFVSTLLKWLFTIEIIYQYVSFYMIIMVMMLSMIIMIWNYFSFMSSLFNNKINKKKYYLNKVFSILLFLFMFMFNIFMIFLFWLY